MQFNRKRKQKLLLLKTPPSGPALHKSIIAHIKIIPKYLIGNMKTIQPHIKVPKNQTP
jgi:hypothetical protein